MATITPVQQPPVPLSTMPDEVYPNTIPKCWVIDPQGNPYPLEKHVFTTCLTVVRLYQGCQRDQLPAEAKTYWDEKYLEASEKREQKKISCEIEPLIHLLEHQHLKKLSFEEQNHFIYRKQKLKKFAPVSLEYIRANPSNEHFSKVKTVLEKFLSIRPYERTYDPEPLKKEISKFSKHITKNDKNNFNDSLSKATPKQLQELFYSTTPRELRSILRTTPPILSHKKKTDPKGLDLLLKAIEQRHPAQELV